MVEDQYGSLAGDYHWFFDDADLLLGCDTPGVRAAMAVLRPGSRVLDAACGIGVDAEWLSRRGFEVVATDASEAMVEQARRRLATSDAIVVRSSWADLPARVEGLFDAVFCVGNSIAHAAGQREMIAAFEAFRAVLAPGGVMVVDSHDWELVFAAGNRTMVEPDVVERDGSRCVRAYSWHLPERFGAPCVFEICPILLDGDRVSLRSHAVRMYPFTRAQVRDRLVAAGFGDVAIDAIPGDDRYTATARRPLQAR